MIKQKFDFDFSLTEYKKHSVTLIENAIKQGITKFICVGGDGTLHNMGNGILNLNPPNISEIKIGIIPAGTGNDWAKTFKISKDPKKAIQNNRFDAQKTYIQAEGELVGYGIFEA